MRRGQRLRIGLALPVLLVGIATGCASTGPGARPARLALRVDGNEAAPPCAHEGADQDGCADEGASAGGEETGEASGFYPGAEPHDSVDEPEGEDAEDDEADEGEEASAGEPASSPLLALSDAELREKVESDLLSLGSLSVGATNAGALVNGVRMPEGEGWVLVDPNNAWGTQETIDALVRCIGRAREAHPESPPLYIGHISAKKGGYLSPHRSHQAGRDVDISYYLSAGAKWYRRAHARNLDRPRTWSFVKALLLEGNVEMILVDASIQRLLKDYAISIGEDREWLDQVFQYGGKARLAPIRHVKGHATHIHIRFKNPVAEALGKKTREMLVAKGLVSPRPQRSPRGGGGYAAHKARAGDTLYVLARRYGTTVEAIKRYNGLKSDRLQVGRTYHIPRSGSAPAKTSKSAAPRGAGFATHRARSGDTLYVLARRYGTTVEAIKQANGLTSDRLKVGRTYRIPKR